MTELPSREPGEPKSFVDSDWVEPMAKLQIGDLPPGAVRANVDGRRISGPMRGFGQMWRKTYRVRLSGANVAPYELIGVWKEKFPLFWPPGNRFFASAQGMVPGAVGLISSSGPVGTRVHTGIVVAQADETSFAFATVEGHPFAGLIAFRALAEAGETVAEVHVKLRASDPLFEVAMRLFGNRKEDEFWRQALTSLATHFGVKAQVTSSVKCLDKKVQWSRVGNISHNAALGSALYSAGAPLRWARGLATRSGG
jgi:hypothetical protein